MRYSMVGFGRKQPTLHVDERAPPDTRRPDTHHKIHRFLFVRVLCDVLAAVGELHNFCYFHRDFKPDSILVDEHGAGKPTDFGMCIKAHDASRRENIGDGTPAYCAPETSTLRGATLASEIYAVAVVLRGRPSSTTARSGAAALPRNSKVGERGEQRGMYVWSWRCGVRWLEVAYSGPYPGSATRCRFLRGGSFGGRRTQYPPRFQRAPYVSDRSKPKSPTFLTDVVVLGSTAQSRSCLWRRPAGETTLKRREITSSKKLALELEMNDGKSERVGEEEEEGDDDNDDNAGVTFAEEELELVRSMQHISLLALSDVLCCAFIGYFREVFSCCRQRDVVPEYDRGAVTVCYRCAPEVHFFTCMRIQVLPSKLPRPSSSIYFPCVRSLTPIYIRRTTNMTTTTAPGCCQRRLEARRYGPGRVGRDGTTAEVFRGAE